MKKIKNNRPDIVIKDYKRKTNLQIDISVSTGHNISVKEYNKIGKYKDLKIKIEKILHLKTTTVCVIERTQGMIKNEADKYFDKIPGCPSLYEI